MTNTIQSLWIGGSLSKMEQLSIQSFLDHGHEYHLYVYGPVQHVPTGAIIKDGNDILPKTDIFTYKNGSYSAFSNLFRFTMLYKKGGYWADTDLICVKKLDIDTPYVFVSEPNNTYNKNIPTSCLIKMPKNSSIAKKAMDIQLEHKQLILSGKIAWGSGPTTVRQIIKEFNLHRYMLHWHGACSCNWNDFLSIVNSKYYRRPEVIQSLSNIPSDMYAIHLWNEVWRRNGLHKNNDYDPNSLYEQLKQKHGIK